MRASGTDSILVRTYPYHPRVAAPGWALIAPAEPALNDVLARPWTLAGRRAGSGKTPLLNAWLASQPHLNARLSLSDRLSLNTADGLPATFLTCLIAAIPTVFPGACAEKKALPRTAQSPSGPC